ncbi:MAG: hypothetical protein COU85_00785 [Candidatus Portnoybacteria bacterium CG10_big_fil_rev_8_21_14_0_10_44_7]|uniref:Uncharacterized protein n=1 Tax=Candidatus Portnoybacteria bacterium CG10_big_fil_rev_8_21_14_0_10_44_7 TaxID=1974816 RepID=A0A2M8KJ80_9BACT|nr:MAG: hypothetical protein COU85_00785 [Candidatus Portnoybacteria bacterium CG10_big_fil_rev_8_21_14_0_10_44_7]
MEPVRELKLADGFTLLGQLEARRVFLHGGSRNVPGGGMKRCEIYGYIRNPHGTGITDKTSLISIPPGSISYLGPYTLKSDKKEARIFWESKTGPLILIRTLLKLADRADLTTFRLAEAAKKIYSQLYSEAIPRLLQKAGLAIDPFDPASAKILEAVALLLNIREQMRAILPVVS